MAMKEMTKAAVDALKERVQDRPFTKNDVIGVSISTLLKYDLIETVEVKSYTVLSVQDTVNLLNALEGSDNWYDTTNGYTYYDIQNGAIVEVNVTYKYQFK